MKNENTDANTVELADRLSRRRARMLPALAAIFIVQQASFFSQGPAERAVDHVRIGAWVLLTAVIVLALNGGGFWFRPAPVRAMIDDEVTRANRAGAMHWGFVAAMLGGMGLYIVQGSAAFTAREAIHLILSLGIVVALLRFAWLERRDHG